MDSWLVVRAPEELMSNPELLEAFTHARFTGTQLLPGAAWA